MYYLYGTQEYVNHHVELLYNYLSNITGNTNIIVGKLERRSVERFIDLCGRFEFRISELKRILKFFSLLNIAFRDEVKQIQLAPWQVFLIANCYCLFHIGTNDRVIKEAVISSAVKQGKSALIVMD
jgi:phage terminase large subunit-like protein